MNRLRWPGTALLLLAATTLQACPAAERPSVPEADLAPAATPPTAHFADAVTASPEHYHVLEETPAARLLLARWSPGESDRPHSHPTAIWFALTPARLRIEHSAGTTLFRTIARGDSGVQPTIAGHSVANVGVEEARFAMFEIHANNLSGSLAGRVGAPAATSSGSEFQLLAEHGGARLVLLTLAPKEVTAAHSHPRAIWLALGDARLVVRERPGSEVNFDLAAGATAVREPVRLETVTNVGQHEAQFLILELP